MTTPEVSFRREAPRLGQRSRYGVYHDGRYLGSAYSLYTGGWYVEGRRGGYESRYVAACSLLNAKVAA